MAGTSRDGRAKLSPSARARGVVAGILAALAALLAPVSLVSGWAWAQVSDTDTFVATYAGLARTPEVQALVREKATAAITARLGVLGQTSIAQELVADAVSTVAGSEGFAVIWEQTLRAAHTQLGRVLTSEPGAVTYADGTLQLQLQPFADAVKQRLVDAQIPFADRLPTITASVPLVEVDPALIARARAGYQALDASATWLPWLALLTGIAAVLLWPSKRRGLIVLGSAIGLVTAAFAAGWEPLVNLAEAAIPESLQPVASVSFELSREPLVSPILGLAALAAVLVFTGLMSARESAD
jgi:hypothetical protein